jgi:DinB family protein
MVNEEIMLAVALGNWKSGIQRADKLFSSLGVDELAEQVTPGNNRLIYLWGHLAAVNDRMIEFLGLGERIHPEWDAVFLTSPDGASELPPVEELRTWWAEGNNRLSAGFARLSAGDWLAKHTAVSNEDFARDPNRNRFAILLSRTNHLSYHLGQIALRKPDRSS